MSSKENEMFENMQDVSKTIKNVVNKPEIIVDATHSNKDTEYYVRSQVKNADLIQVFTSRDSKDTKEASLGLPRNNSTPKTDKSQVKQKLEYLNHFANKQYELWGTTLHNAFFDYYDKLDKGVMPRNRDIETYRISLITAKYDIFCKVFNKATLPYDELKSLKKIISKGQNIDFNDRNLSPYINSFERPYEFVLEHAGNIKDKELKIEICKELAKILSEIEQESQQNIKQLKNQLTHKTDDVVESKPKLRRHK